MHQLIVLGNGFDLECGLHSKFGEFFEKRKSFLDPSDDEIRKMSKPNKAGCWGEYLKEHGLTVWDIILCSESGKYWYDIERAVREWVRKNSDSSNLPDDKTNSADHCEMITQQLKTIVIIPDRSDKKGKDDRNALLCPFTDRSPEGIRAGVAKYIYQTNTSDMSDPVTNFQFPIRQYLFEELKRLEHAFTNYLMHEVSVRSITYFPAARRLMSFLVEDEFPIKNIEQGNTSILDFNYTNPISNSTMEVGTFVNIHGSLKNDDIIFGIDGKDNMSDPEVIPFTKTYRLLALSDPDRGKLVRTRSDANGVTDLIKFYGHSLNPADYSYFQAIFDGVDLYQSHTRLVFYYKPTIEGAQEDTFRKVTRLMNTYGATMENKDHGKNLMHKLLLEGRLTIKRYNG